MRLPVKLNARGWPWFVGRLPIVREDPRRVACPSSLSASEFSASLSVLKFGTTFKTTQPARHAQTDEILVGLLRDRDDVILDIGASDGSTSLDLIARMGPRFAKYYVTDFNVEVSIGRDDRGTSFFRDASDRCILRATDRFVIYADVEGAPAPLAWVARHLLRGEERVATWNRVSLFQKDLLDLTRVDSRVETCQYDMFKPWRGRRPTLTKIANVLNRAYFSDDDITQAIRTQLSALEDGGHLAIIENRKNRERATIYQKSGAGMVPRGAVGGGCELEGLVSSSRLVR